MAVAFFGQRFPAWAAFFFFFFFGDPSYYEIAEVIIFFKYHWMF